MVEVVEVVEEVEATVVRRGSPWSAISGQLNWLKLRMMSEEGRQARIRRRTIESSDPANESRQNPLDQMSSIQMVELEGGGDGGGATEMELPMTSESLAAAAEEETNVRDMHTNPMKRNKSST